MLSNSEIIRIAARRAGLSLSELATATGQTRQNLSNKLSRDAWTVKDLQAMAEATGCTLSISWIDCNGQPIE